MRRRRVLAAISLALPGVAGCTSGPGKTGPEWGPPETEPGTPTRDRSTLRTTASPAQGFELSFETPDRSDTDAFVVVVTVTNTRDDAHSATLVVTWERDDEQETREQVVSLAGGAETTIEFEFPDAGNLSFDWREN